MLATMSNRLVLAILLLPLGCGPNQASRGASETETGTDADTGTVIEPEPLPLCVDELIDPAGQLQDVRPAIADLDGDGHLDILARRHGQDALLAWGDGQGGFEFEFYEGYAADPGRFLVGQVDADPALDLVGYEWGPGNNNHVSVSMQREPREFELAPVSVLPGLWETPESVPAVLMEVDADGRTDLVFGDFLSNATVNLSTAFGDGLGGFGPPVSATWALPHCRTRELVAADFDGSGDLELLVVASCWAAPTILALVSLDSEGQATVLSEQSIVDGVTGSPVIADLDGDGLLDLAFANAAGVQILIGRGDGSFAPGPNLGTPPDITGFINLVGGQFDGLGGTDLIATFSGPDWGRHAWILRDPLAPGPVSIEPLEADWYIYTGDFDEDGCDDLLHAGPTNDPPGRQYYLRRCPAACSFASAED